MSGITFKPDIDKTFILDRISEEEIYERYGVKVQEGLFCSPLRRDIHPTCRFYRSRAGRLILHDFAGHFHGDCFDLVQKLKGCKFYDALDDIAKAFGIIKGGTRHPAASAIIIGPRTLCDLRVKSMPWDEQHLSWWEEYGISIDVLEKYKVVAVDRVWLNGSLYYNRDHTKKREVVFAYKFGSLDYKIYFPMRDKIRFLHNNPDILQGFLQLPEEPRSFVVITKSMKDVMCLNTFGIAAIAPMAETSVVTDSVIETLSENFRRIFALYDRDKTGMIALLNLRKRGITPVMMPLGTTKDFADLCKKDLPLAKLLVEEFISHYSL